jgi:hypothetical protein
MASKKINLILFRKILRLFKISLVFVSNKGNDVVNYIPIKNKYYKSEIQLGVIFPYMLLKNKINNKRIQVAIIRYVGHEIGHLLVVNKRRQRQKNFGIPEVLIDNTDKYDIEEYKAQAIEHELSTKLNLGTQHRVNLTYKKYPEIVKWKRDVGDKMVDNIIKSAMKVKL